SGNGGVHATLCAFADQTKRGSAELRWRVLRVGVRRAQRGAARGDFAAAAVRAGTHGSDTGLSASGPFLPRGLPLLFFFALHLPYLLNCHPDLRGSLRG